MTLEEYLALVPSWNSQRPKFMSTLAALVQPLVDSQTFLASLTADFDLDTAVGVQLDAVGRWLNRDRFIDQPITGVYFSFDLASERVGFDQGIWFSGFDPTEAIIALDDETYRTILRLQAIANQWDGTLPSMQAPLDAVFPGIIVQDKGDIAGDVMTMDVLIPSHLLSSLLLGILTQDYPVKPAGVLTNFIETTLQGVPIFGFDVAFTTNGPFGGFDQAAWGIIISTQ
jgi:hypothetical protein